MTSSDEYENIDFELQFELKRKLSIKNTRNYRKKQKVYETSSQHEQSMLQETDQVLILLIYI